MRLIVSYAMAASLSLATFTHAAEDRSRTTPAGTSPVTNQAAERLAPTTPSSPATGRPENRWRYRFSQDRWWYWTPDGRWSYFDGSRWVPYRSAGGFTRKVDPALLRIEAKEGVLGMRKWDEVRRQAADGASGAPEPGVGWAVSGTRGSIGGAPTSAFTNPSPLPRPGWRTPGMGKGR